MKKNYITILFSMMLCFTCIAQVGIGANTPEAALDVSSSNSGVLFPRVSSASDVTNPVNSMVVYDNSQQDFFQYSSTSNSWVKFGLKTSTLNGSTTTLYFTAKGTYNHILDFCFTPLSSATNNGYIKNNFCGRFMINKRPNSSASIVRIIYLLDGNGNNITPSTQTSTTVEWVSIANQRHTITVNDTSATYTRGAAMSGRLHYKVFGLNPF